MTSQLIVIGTSAGGVDALLTIAGGLPPNFPAPILVVLHIGTHRSLLPGLMNARGPNETVEAVDGEALKRGTIYIAPPDHHLMVKAGRIVLGHGPKENHSRPAIDALFRSAALDMGERVIGIILTGMLDDGTAGLRAIKDCGGTTIVQEPGDAFAPGMPASALINVNVDHVARLDQMATLMVSLMHPGDWKYAASEASAAAQAPEALRREHAAHFGTNDMEAIEAIGAPSPHTCPDCGGTLFELFDKRPVRYLCHTGHSFSLRTLAHAQERVTDEALWRSLRTLQEKRSILNRLAEVQAAEAPGSEAATLTDAAELEKVTAALRAFVEKAPSSQSFDRLAIKKVNV